MTSFTQNQKIDATSFLLGFSEWCCDF